MIHCGDALTVLRTLESESVHCCITSPPYYGLRDYGCDGQIGLERTPAEYIAKLVAVFAEVRRVLRADGTCWVNIGDSYTSGGRNSQVNDNIGSRGPVPAGYRSPQPPGLKPKDLIGIPWALAFALRDDGWWLRQDIIWHKPNPMPESVRDRCTKAHEYVFLLTKSARYFYQADAIAEGVTGNAHSRGNGVNPKAKIPAGWDTGAGSHRELTGRYRPKQNESWSAAVTETVDTRNRRSVWTLATQPTPEAHFATFPLELPELCMRAGCPEGGVVLDPFAGAGTTGLACVKNNRQFIGIELKPEYVAIAESRLQKRYPLFA
jgi:DNA modification methylase